MKTRNALGLAAIGLASLAAVSLPGASAADVKVEEFFGAGSRATSVTRVSEALGDCGDTDPLTNILLATSRGTVTYTGIIEGTGAVLTKTIIDRCVLVRPHGSFRLTDTFGEVTIGGRKGGAVIEVVGDLDQSGGVSTTNSTTRILCGTGDLEHAHGEGIGAGTSTATSASSTYALWIHFDHDHDAGFDFLCHDLDDAGSGD